MSLCNLCVVILLAVSQLSSRADAKPAVPHTATPKIAEAKAADIILAGPTVAPCPVVFDSTLTTPDAALIRLAAADLVKYLSQISGQKFTIVAASDLKTPRAIILGLPAATAAPAMSEEEFSIKTDGQALRITGGGGRGVAYGTYWFLEHCLGCKWWSYNEEDIPTASTLRIPTIDIQQKPAFAMHDLMNREAQNGTGNFLYKIHSTSAVAFTGGHTLNNLLTPYAKQNPEFWPMDKNGVRKANNIHFNYLAPGISDALTEALSAEVENRHQDISHYIYQAGMGDWYGGMDMSPASTQMYDAETWTNPDGLKLPGYSATLLTMVNDAAGKLAKKYPGIQVGTFAYMSLEAPPANIRPAANVNIWVPRLRHDTVLSVEESDENKTFRRNLEQWTKIAPGRVYLWEYATDFDNFMMPFPCLKSMAQNIAYYHRIGVQGIMIQGNYVSTGGDLAVLKNYVLSKLLWQPSLDVDKLIREFCKGYYGPAAGEIVDYVNDLEDSVRKPVQIHANEFDTKRVYLTPALVNKLRGLLTKAKAATVTHADQPWYRRVREVEASLEAWELWRPGTIVEQDGKLIRTDISPEKGGEDTYARAQEQIKYSRDASPREWGVAAYYQTGFLSMNGGPLAGINRGALEAKIAPRNAKRLWRLTLGGKDVIDGSEVNYTPNAAWFDIDPAAANAAAAGPPAAKVSLYGEAGLADWSLTIKQGLGETYELVDDHTLRISGSVKSLLPKQPADSAASQATIETRYNVDDTTKFSCEALVEGTWSKLEVGPLKLKVAIPAGATQLRVTRADRGLVVLDKYTLPAVTGGNLVYDPAGKLFKTVVALAPDTLPTAKDEVKATFVREIEVQPIP